MLRTATAAALAIALILAIGAGATAAEQPWKLKAAALGEYAKLATPEKQIAEKWLSKLPDKPYRESFRQLVMGLVLWSAKEPIAFLDYEFVKLFETKGKVVDIYTFQAGEAKMETEIYSPPVIPGDL